MNSVIDRFVTVRKTRGDLLNPTQYRSIVELIRGILNKYDFKGLNEDYKKLLAHLIDFNDPHHDSHTSFYTEIVEKTYAIYVNMTPIPLSLPQFKTQIAPTLSFLELIRRILLNRYLYDQIKLPDGTTPISATVTLSDEWRPGIGSMPLVVNFSSVALSENDFIKLGWNGTHNPPGIIFNANDLVQTKALLPLVFETSSEAPYLSDIDVGVNYPVALSLSSNDVTISIKTVSKPSAIATVLLFRNGVDTLKITLTPSNVASVVLNAQSLIASLYPSDDGIIKVTFNKQGFVSLTTSNNDTSSTQIGNFILSHDVPFTTVAIGIGYETSFDQSFGLRSLEIYAGCLTDFVALSFNVPDNYALLTDPDGAYIFDPDGTPLMDIDVTVPDGYDILIDSDGSYLQDSDGYFLVSPQTNYTTLPDLSAGYVFLTDDDGAYLRDDDGAYIVILASDTSETILPPSGMVMIVDSDGYYLIDSDGNYIVAPLLEVSDDNSLAYMADPDGSYLVDQDGSYLVEPF